jgi:hypothetical protein
MTRILKRAVQAVTRTIADRAIADAPPLTPVSIGTPVSRVDGHLR